MHNTQQPQEVHPVLILTLGSTPAEVILMIEFIKTLLDNVVPFGVISFDSLTYAELVARFEKNGWPKEAIDRSFPRHNYLQLENPITERFDFDAPIARSWNNIFFEPSLKRLAKSPMGQGCAGTPAFGRAWVEHSADAICDKVENAIQGLTRVGQDTIGLKPGILCFLLTSARGGTGSGGAAVFGGLVRSVLPEGSQLHLQLLMPSISKDDKRAHANGSAVMRELQHYHRDGGGVALKDGRVLPPPFSTVTPIFSSNGSLSLGPHDGLSQLISTLRPYLRAPTQATINAGRVDLTDVLSHDHLGRPMHITQQLAFSVRVTTPGVCEYLAASWVYRATYDALDRFNAWSGTKRWYLGEKNRVLEITDVAVDDLNLTRDVLVGRLEPSPSPTNKLRTLIEQAHTALPGMQPETIKAQMRAMPGRVREQFQDFDDVWRTKRWELSQTLTREVTQYLGEHFPLEPHLVLATSRQIRSHIAGQLVPGLQKALSAAKAKRDAAGAQIGKALAAIAGPAPSSGGMLGWFKGNSKDNSHVHQAAQKALQLIFAAGLARIEQERLEWLLDVLVGDVKRGHLQDKGRWGEAIATPSLMSALEQFEQDEVLRVRRFLTERLDTVQTCRDALAQRIDKQSPIFERSLLYDGMNRARLDAEIAAAFKDNPHPEPIKRYLLGEADLDDVIEGLFELLPSAAESGLKLTEFLLQDDSKRQFLMQLLRNTKPFTPLDRTVEDQQELTGRRDTFCVLEIPGGASSPLASVFVQEGIVSHVEKVLDSGEEEIRWLMLRDGLPYCALRPLNAKFKRCHDDHLSRSGSITPYTRAEAIHYADFAPPRVSLTVHTARVLHQFHALFPERLLVHPIQGWTLHYHKDTGYGHSAQEEYRAPHFESLVRWVAANPAVRVQLEQEIHTKLDSNLAEALKVLALAWQRSTIPDTKAHLKEVLYSLQCDPHALVQNLD